MIDQPALPDLPRTWRPLGVRMAGAVFAVVLVGAFAWMWIRFSDETRESVNLWQRLTVIALVGGGVALMHALARSKVVATQAGLRIVNGYRTRRLAWADVGAVRMPQGAPWPHLEQSENRRISMIGIQTSDGARAATAVRELRAIVAARQPPS